MTTLKNLLPVLISGLLLTSCGNSEEPKEEPIETKGIELADVPGSPEFDGATIGIGKVSAEAQGEDSAKVSFNFDVKNYELMSQTPDAGGKQCSNSDKGQHIHFILDNKPYAALYEPMHDVVLSKNSEHYLLVFLSRSYHESVKSPGAAAVYHFKVDEKGKVQVMDAPTEPMVFYSRPKGDYLGKDTENLLFDFYVWNTTLSADGNKVKAEIKGDGLDTTITMNTWKSQFLKNMPMGKSSIKLTLIDAAGNQISGPSSEVTREFTLAKDEPMAAH